MTAARTTDAPLNEQREKTATRLLGSSSKNSYDPFLDIDWEAPADPSLGYLPFEHVSLYGTPLWDAMTPEQRVELSRHELASIAATGLWFEMILIQMLSRYAFDLDPQSAHMHYTMTEIGDETRHIVMFAKSIKSIGAPTYRPNRLVHNLARIYKATSGGTALFAPVLVAEEVTDRLQRVTMNDESIQPLIRMVNRIHVVEEARHVRFAREEVARLMQTSGPVRTLINNTLAAIVAAFVVTSLVSPDVYRAVGLDPKEATRVARKNPNYRASRRFLGEKIMTFLRQHGMVTWSARPFYRAAGLI